jgi:uncharacterized protein (DUF1800 family)
MAVTNLKKNLHLMWRVGFGPQLPDLSMLSVHGQRQLAGKLLHDSADAPASIDVASEEVKQFYALSSTPRKSPAMDSNMNKPAETERRRIATLSRIQIKDLNVVWLRQMVNGKDQLREKLSLFWHGHFAASSGNIIHQQKLLNVIRVNALGKFGDLLKEVSRSASMITYLNNNQNRKNHPNENFARELLELFTLGRGNYTEKDIKEAARAFTGWGTNGNGDFIFRKQQHDSGEKTFMGKTGNFDGEHILNILLERKETARFITTRIYRYFVNENVDPDQINLLADKFYASGYDIKSLLEHILTSDWFYSEKNIGNRIKSPVELLVGIRRTLAVDAGNEDAQLLLQRLLGQVLFRPPNVAGWPGGYSWIDSSSLMLRLQLPKIMIQQEEVALAPKADDDQMMGRMETGKLQTRRRRIAGPMGTAGGNANWKDYINVFAKTGRSDLADHISTILLVGNPANNELIKREFADTASREAFIKSVSTQMMCTPEYQLC